MKVQIAKWLINWLRDSLAVFMQLKIQLYTCVQIANNLKVTGYKNTIASNLQRLYSLVSKWWERDQLERQFQ